MNILGPLARVVTALGITQIIGWGSLYYSIAVLAKPMAHSMACDSSWIFGAFSASLVTSGFVAPLAGRAIDRLGGRVVLGFGSLLAALALGLIALASSLPLFFIGWLLAGAAMACCLYDAAFPALSQIAGERYRSALTALTLFGGLASTMFWPLAWQLNATLDWRSTLGIFALMHLCICLPLHRWVLPLRPDKTPSESFDKPAYQSRMPAQIPASLIWLATAFTLNAFVFTAIGAHVVDALSANLDSPATAVWIATLIGPMQVGGRIIEFTLGRRLTATRVGIVVFAVTALSTLLLWQTALAWWLAFGFAILYGLANGVMTIVRGMVPAVLYGRAYYGELTGFLARPAFFAKACAPLLIALFLERGGTYALMGLGLSIISALALIAYSLAIRKATLPNRATSVSTQTH